MKIFFWPASSVDGTYLYRIAMQRDILAERGHQVECSQRLSMWAHDDAQVVVGQRVAMPGPLFMWQKLIREQRDRGLRLVYEMDDDLLAINTLSNPLGTVLRQPTHRRVMVECMQTADMLTVSTEPLARSLSRFNDNVVVLPNGVRESIFDVPLSTRRGTLNHGAVLLGWQGSSTHADDWDIVKETVADILTVEPYVLMRFLGTPYGEGLPLHRLSFRRWTTDLEQHYRRVAAFDIGLAPLTRSPFNDAKSGLKFIEYAALGVPAICSNVPAYADLVEHGKTGFLASTAQQWRKHLDALIHDPAMRVEIGNAARAAARNWTIEKKITLWEDAYASLL